MPLPVPLTVRAYGCTYACASARVSVYLCASYVHHNRALAESSGGHLIALQSQRDCVARCAPCSESGRADQAETKTVVAPCRVAPWQLHRLGLQLRCGCGLVWAAQLCGEWRQLCDGLWAELRRWRAQREHCAVGGIVCHIVMDVGDSVELLVESRYVAPRRPCAYLAQPYSITLVPPRFHQPFFRLSV